jgi:hypothetical protein
MVAPDALSRNPLPPGTVELYEVLERLYTIPGEFSSAALGL